MLESLATLWFTNYPHTYWYFKHLFTVYLTTYFIFFFPVVLVNIFWDLREILVYIQSLCFLLLLGTFSFHCFCFMILVKDHIKQILFDKIPVLLQYIISSPLVSTSITTIVLVLLNHLWVMPPHISFAASIIIG